MKIQVLVKNVYGLPTVYPVCKVAQTFAKIAETKTLKESTLHLIKSMGYEIEQVLEHTDVMSKLK